MKKISLFLSLIIFANYIQATNVAIVDGQKVMAESVAMKSIQSQLEKITHAAQKVITAEEQKLRDKKIAIEEKKTNLSEQAYSHEVLNFQKQVAEMQKNFQGKKSEIEKAHNKAMEKITAIINKIIADIAREQKIELVIPKGFTNYSLSSLDITNEVIKRLNAKITKVTVEISK